MEYRVQRHDGEWRWVLDTAVPRLSPDGVFLGYIGSCIDIDDRKKAEAALDESHQLLKAIIEGMGGKILKVDNWGKRRLAYEVAKERKGIYLYWLYLALPGIVEEIERNLRMLDSVIRYLTVKVDENIDLGARPTELDDGAYEKAAQTAADEEDLFLSRGGEDLATTGDDDDYTADDFVDEAAMATVEKEKE